MMYVCVCMRVCTCVCSVPVCVCMCMYVRMYRNVCLYVRTCVCLCLCLPACVRACVYVCICLSRFSIFLFLVKSFRGSYQFNELSHCKRQNCLRMSRVRYSFGGMNELFILFFNHNTNQPVFQYIQHKTMRSSGTYSFLLNVLRRVSCVFTSTPG